MDASHTNGTVEVPTGEDPDETNRVSVILPVEATPRRSVPRADARHGGPSWFAYALALLVAAAMFAISDPQMLFSDFRVGYRPAGVAVLHGLALDHLIEQLLFVNLPIMAYLFTPLAVLPSPVACALFLLGGLVATVIAYRLLSDMAGLDRAGRHWLLFLFALNGPLIYSLREGNASEYVLLLLVGALVMLRGGRDVAGGALLGAAALIKLPLLLFGLYLLARRNVRAVAGFVAITAGAALLSVAVFGAASNLAWFDIVIGQFRGHAFAAYNVQSITAALLRLRDPSIGLEDWNLHATDPADRTVAAVIVGGFFIAAALAALLGRGGVRRLSPPADRQTIALEFMLVLCLALLSSPLAWSHYYCWLLIPTAFCIGGPLPMHRVTALRWLSIPAILLVTLPVRRLAFPDSAMAHAYGSWGVLNDLAGGVLWFAVIIAACLFRPSLPASAPFSDALADVLAYGRKLP